MAYDFHESFKLEAALNTQDWSLFSKDLLFLLMVCVSRPSPDFVKYLYTQIVKEALSIPDYEVYRVQIKVEVQRVFIVTAFIMSLVPCDQELSKFIVSSAANAVSDTPHSQGKHQNHHSFECRFLKQGFINVVN